MGFARVARSASVVGEYSPFTSLRRFRLAKVLAIQTIDASKNVRMFICRMQSARRHLETKLNAKGNALGRPTQKCWHKDRKLRFRS